ncbi:hypothetical protein LSH36_115g01007 [Paralvinella palmiformis]|uniref:Palmitoyltransferase n=1 Tax=Paralvinella palmiformis TaxID=53620 RepID=A0AAD9JYA9_9ANNE|nr:hypothetical protein LSH36_115g01007 [Paralvinella palmiformis]
MEMHRDHSHSYVASRMTKITLTESTKLEESVQNLHLQLAKIELDDLQTLLTKNPQAVHEKAVRISDIKVVNVLLEHKADPNTPNNLEETPFHLACERGDVQILNSLLKNRADIELVGQEGKCPIHYAAHGGSVLALHFLTEVCGLSSQVRDASLNTPLHIVCAHEHEEALSYLLKNERSDLFAHNVYGNNALHLAANTGNVLTCWSLLDAGGLQLLHERNGEGKLPLDLVIDREEVKYLWAIRVLTHYTDCDQKSGRPRGPLLGWFFNLMIPIVSYPLLIILSYQTPRPGLVTIEGSFLMAVVIVLHSARLNHMSHSILVIYQQHLLLVMAIILLNVVSCAVYVLLLTRSPAFGQELAKKPGSLVTYTIMDIANGTLPHKAFCVHCELIPPRGSRHCSICNRCYLDRDHHCLFLYRCIARHNHRLFLWFICLVISAIILFDYSLLVYMRTIYRGRQIDKTIILDIFYYMPWHWTLLVGNIVSLVPGFGNLAYLLYTVSKAHTVPPVNITSSKLTFKQRFYNIVYFAMGWGFYATDDGDADDNYPV